MISVTLPPTSKMLALSILQYLSVRVVGPLVRSINKLGESNDNDQQLNRSHFWTWAKDSVFLVGSIVAIMAAFCNSLNWLVQCFWGPSNDFWQTMWERCLQHIGDNEFNLYVYGTTILTMSLYWGVGMIYVAMDLFNLPNFIRKYKVQPGMNEPLEPKKLVSAIGLVLFNQIFVGLPFTIIGFWLMEQGGNVPCINVLPTFRRALLEMVVFILVEEVAFYYSHRLLHHRRLYKHIHKRHHEWTSPIAITAVYCHPLEHIFSNLLPPALGTVVMGSHIAVAWLWFSYAILRTLNDHSGYHLPWLPSPEAHDFHHLKFTECYGFLGILDYYHGTDRNFRSSAYYDRHAISMKLEPMRTQFPDQDKHQKMQ